MVNRQVTGMHTLFPLLPPKHNKVSDDPGLYLVTLTKCLGELGVNCPRVSLPELEEMGTERVLLVNWELPKTLNIELGVIWLLLPTPSFSLGE